MAQPARNRTALLDGLEGCIEHLVHWPASRRRRRARNDASRGWPLVYGQVLPAGRSGSTEVKVPSAAHRAQRWRLAGAAGVFLIVVVLATWYAEWDRSQPIAEVRSGSDLMSGNEPAPEAANADTVSVRRILAAVPADEWYSPLGAGWGVSAARPPAVDAVSRPLAPTLLKQVKPEYPETARSAGVEGTVVVTYMLDREGRPRDLTVTQSVRMLDQAVLDALRQWEYTAPSEAVASQRYRHHAEFVLNQ